MRLEKLIKKMSYGGKVRFFWGDHRGIEMAKYPDIMGQVEIQDMTGTIRLITSGEYWDSYVRQARAENIKIEA